MDSKDILHLNETFAAQMLALRQAAWAQGPCRVNINILYGLPDHPSIAQEFIHQTDDVFTPGATVAKEIKAYEDKMKAAKTIRAMLDIFEDWRVFREKSDALLQTSEKLTKPMRLVFKAATPAQQADMIARSVQFPNTRDFLLFWTRKLDGPMREVLLDPAMLLGLDNTPRMAVATSYRIN